MDDIHAILKCPYNHRFGMTTQPNNQNKQQIVLTLFLRKERLHGNTQKNTFSWLIAIGNESFIRWAGCANTSRRQRQQCRMGWFGA